MALSKMPSVEEIIQREIAKRRDVLWSFPKENVLYSALIYCECFEMFLSVWLDLIDKIKWGYLKFVFFFFETGNFSLLFLQLIMITETHALLLHKFVNYSKTQ